MFFRGWFPNVTPKGGGGPWPSDIAAFYAGRREIGPPLGTLTWQKKVAEFHWSGWLPPEDEEADEEEEWDENQPDRQDLCELAANWADGLDDEELLIEECLAEERARLKSDVVEDRRHEEQIRRSYTADALAYRQAFDAWRAERERQTEAERERQAEAEKRRCPHCGGVLP